MYNVKLKTQKGVISKTFKKKLDIVAYSMENNCIVLSVEHNGEISNYNSKHH